jgi:hypothetical protein
MMTDDLATMHENWTICGSISATPITSRQPFQGLSPVRKRLQFPTFANNHNHNSKQQRARRLRFAIGLYFVLCVCLSTLAFTWMMASTVDHGGHLTSYNAFVASSLPNLRNPFQRVSMSRNMLQQSEEYETHEIEPSQDQHHQQTEAGQLGRPKKEQEQNTVVPFSNSQVPVYLRIPDEEPVVQVISTRYVPWLAFFKQVAALFQAFSKSTN